jgi:hypothetical protein
MELQSSRKQLQSAKVALQDVTNQANYLKKQRSNSWKKVSYYKSIQDILKEDLAELQEENFGLLKTMSDVEYELSENESTDYFIMQTKRGQRYSPTIRKLYYTLLANQVPASKIAEIIRTVVKSFNPSIDIEQLKLPQKGCASYVRKDELKTVSEAHKVTLLCQQTSENAEFKLNTDGTTKGQKNWVELLLMTLLFLSMSYQMVKL